MGPGRAHHLAAARPARRRPADSGSSPRQRAPSIRVVRGPSHRTRRRPGPLGGDPATPVSQTATRRAFGWSAGRAVASTTRRPGPLDGAVEHPRNRGASSLLVRGPSRRLHLSTARPARRRCPASPVGRDRRASSLQLVCWPGRLRLLMAGHLLLLVFRTAAIEVDQYAGLVAGVGASSGISSSGVMRHSWRWTRTCPRRG